MRTAETKRPGDLEASILIARPPGKAASQLERRGTGPRELRSVKDVYGDAAIVEVTRLLDRVVTRRDASARWRWRRKLTRAIGMTKQADRRAISERIDFEGNLVRYFGVFAHVREFNATWLTVVHPADEPLAGRAL